MYERHVRSKRVQKELVVPKIGDVVLIDGEKLPRRQWRMGRVTDIRVGRGNEVRECTVQTLSPKGACLSKILRSPDKLVPLEVDSREVSLDQITPLEGDPRKNLVPWEKMGLGFKKRKNYPSKSPYRIEKSFKLRKNRLPHEPGKVSFVIPKESEDDEE